jgi:hypothetical protein
VIVFQSSFVTTLATAGTTLLSLSFVFAVTTQEFLGSCIFLFVKHPYDVGDRVDITGPEKEQLIVEKISLLYTVFTRIDKMQVVQVPNIILNNQWIENVTRSKAMKEVIDVNVSFDTSFEDIELLRLEMEEFVRSPDNSRDFQPDISIGVGGVGDCDKITLKVVIKHKSNWHNDAVRATRRSKFMCALALALKRVPINGPGGGGDALGGPANPAYSVAVTDDFAAVAREKSEKEKEAKRLANQSAEDAANAAAAEQRAAGNINTTNPVLEALDDWGYDNTRDPSADHKRASDTAAATASRADALSTGVSTRDSQRGRRRAGETLPPHSFGDDAGVPAVHLTRTSTSSQPGKRPSFDVERQAGIPPPAGSPYNTWAAYNAQAPSPSDAGVHPQGVYGGPPPPPQSPPMGAPQHLSVGSQQGHHHQQQQQHGSAVPGRPLVGSRPRGASMSRPEGLGGSGPGTGTGQGGAGPSSGRI